VDTELKRMWKEVVVVYAEELFHNYPGVTEENLRNTVGITKHRDLNPRRLEYEACVHLIQWLCLIFSYVLVISQMIIIILIIVIIIIINSGKN
jgi:hypothetical protein